jgi:hypothetical protein
MMRLATLFAVVVTAHVLRAEVASYVSFVQQKAGLTLQLAVVLFQICMQHVLPIA